MKTVKPLGNRVVVKRSEAKTTKGGILLPDNSQEKPRQGKVLAVGPGKADEKGRLSPVQVKVGDEVLFTNYAGSEFKLDSSSEVVILTEDDILAVVS